MSFQSIRFPSGQVSLAQPFSVLEAEAEKHGIALLENKYRQSRGFRTLAAAFSRFLNDQDGELALKKSLHIVYEGRLKTAALRVDPPTRYGFRAFDVSGEHPLDGLAQRDLEQLDPDSMNARVGVRRRAKIYQFAALLGYGLGFVAQAMQILVFGATSAVRCRTCRVAMPNHWHGSKYVPLLGAAKGSPSWTHDSFLFVMEKPDNASVYDLGIPTLRVDASLKVPRREWLRKAALPALRLFVSAMASAVRFYRDPIAVEAALQSMRLGRQSLHVWRLAMNLRCLFFLDTGDYTAEHILKRAILAKSGTKMVRWPGSQSDSYSSITSYIAFDIYFSGGVYQQENFSGSWSDRVRVVPIGSTQFDRRMLEGAQLDPAYERIVTDRIEQGQKLVAYFGTSPIAPMEPVEMDSLLAVCRQAVSEPDWFLVIKPKGASSTLADAMRADKRFAPYLNHPDILWVEYLPDGGERCPSGWLIEKMTLGTGDQGSVMTEALSRRKPYLAYYPIAFPTPLRERMVQDGFFFTEPEALETALGQSMREFPNIRTPSDYYSTNFGAFDDHCSLDRLVGVLFDENSAAE